MHLTTSAAPLSTLDTDLLLVPLAAKADLGALADLGAAVAHAAADFKAKAGTSTLVYPEGGQPHRVALLGLGEAPDAEALRRAAAVGAALARTHEAATVALSYDALQPDDALTADDAVAALTEGFVLGTYQFLRYKTEDDAPYTGPRSLLLHGTHAGAEAAATRARTVAEAVCTARDLVNLSPNDKTATLLADAIRASGQAHGYDVEVWAKARIEAEGMGGLLAVNLGSLEPPTFTVMTWKPEEARNTAPLVLVGKGVVFDTGGLSLKPTMNSMDHMKADMAGAAAVVGAMEAIAGLQLPLHVIALIPATDNRPGQAAYVPGDVIRMHSGATVEVLNTDAEGRMLLADALSYAQSFDPALVIDLATLTGAAVIALGDRVGAVLTNETDGAQDRLAAMEDAGHRSGDRVHRLPMYADYAKQLESTVADFKNVGGRPAGTITAAKFLEHFVDYPWIHLDIAGPAFTNEKRPYSPPGGSGFGVRLLAQFLQDYAARLGG